MSCGTKRDIAHDLVLPTVLFAALGGMTWAIRGSAGYGAAAGCIFAGVTLGTAWWFIARDPGPVQSRRYASGWIILAMTIAFGIAGTRGWMQWSHFFNNTMYTNFRQNEFVYIDRIHGFVWLFIAGIPWAGLGACALAWCTSERRTTPGQWLLRLACAIGMAWFLSIFLYQRYPHVFLPLYDSLQDKYQDLRSYKELWKIHRDNREAMIQLGLYLGFLFFEVFRRDWRNVLLIGTVGLVNGVGWSALQCWKWADRLWPDAQFNFWRAWETTGGISIGIAFGLAYFLVNRPIGESTSAHEEPDRTSKPPGFRWLIAFVITALIVGWLGPEVMPHWCATLLTVVSIAFAFALYVRAKEHKDDTAQPHHAVDLERWGAYAGLILGLGLSIKNGLKGSASIYLGNEGDWNTVMMSIMGSIMIVALVALSVWVLLRPRSIDHDPFPCAYTVMWIVLLIQNTLAQLVTGPPTHWHEMVYNIYYLLLFALSGVIVCHYQFKKTCQRGVMTASAPPG